MQKNYFLKALFSFLFCISITISYGANWYISSTGSDATGDGLTPATAWASFSKAQTAAASVDIINVSGMIDFTLDPANTVTNAGTTTTPTKQVLLLLRVLQFKEHQQLLMVLLVQMALIPLVFFRLRMQRIHLL